MIPCILFPVRLVQTIVSTDLLRHSTAKPEKENFVAEWSAGHSEANLSPLNFDIIYHTMVMFVMEAEGSS